MAQQDSRNQETWAVLSEVLQVWISGRSTTVCTCCWGNNLRRWCSPVTKGDLRPPQVEPQFGASAWKLTATNHRAASWGAARGVTTLLSACFGCLNITDANSLLLFGCFIKCMKRFKNVWYTIRALCAVWSTVLVCSVVFLKYFIVFISLMFAAAGGTLQFPQCGIIETNSIPSVRNSTTSLSFRQRNWCCFF